MLQHIGCSQKLYILTSSLGGAVMALNIQHFPEPALGCQLNMVIVCVQLLGVQTTI